MAHVRWVNNRDPREVAVRVLQRREKGAEYTEDILTQELADANLSPADRGLAHETTYGVVRRETTLDWLIDRKSHDATPKGAVRILLRLGLYQLFWLERIPDHAAVNETVALAKRLGYRRQAGFINAVLRGFLREREATERLLGDLRAQKPALACSHPEWLFRRWEKRWGRETAILLMDWNNQPPSTFARVNTLRIQPDALLAMWANEGVSYIPFEADWISSGLVFELRAHPRLADLPSFKSGFFYVQDPSTLLAVQQLAPEPGEAVLDLCAAPGGKATFIAQLMSDQGRVEARDLHSERLRMIEENCQRLGVASVHPVLVPEAAAPPDRAAFDRVLVDAPCSNTGVMRRRVDVRWRIRPEELDKLRASQLALLKRAAGEVKPGGILVYSTCSVEPEENREVIDLFLGERRDFQLETERELLPFKDGVDGAYVARLLRANAPLAPSEV